MIRELCLAAVVATALSGCGAAQSTEGDAAAKTDPQSTAYWQNGMNEASDRMTAEANGQKTGRRVTGRRKEGTASWNARSGEDEGAPTDAPESGWGD